MGGTEGVGGYSVGEGVRVDYRSGYEDIQGGKYGDGYGYVDEGDGDTGPVPLEYGGGDDADGLPRGPGWRRNPLGRWWC